MNIKLWLKKKFRSLYYNFFNHEIVRISKPDVLSGNKWMINKNYGRAYYKGYYEPLITEYLIKVLQKEGVFYDIGAHCGYFSLIASEICKEGATVSFEPSPQNFDFLKQIKELNFSDRWLLVNKAVSNSKGQIKFLAGKTSSTGRISEKGELLVDQIDLDSFIEESKLSPTIIKIDVEGHADQVLNGFSKFESLDNNCKLLIEIHDNSDEWSYIINRFGNNYSITNIHGQELNLEDKVSSHVIITKRDT